MRLFCKSATYAVSPSAETTTPVGVVKSPAPVPKVPKVVWFFHAPMQTFAEVLQNGVVPPQSLLLTQATQVSVDGLQNGVLPPHWLSLRHPTQVFDVVLQTGVLPPQVLLLTQATQMFVVVLQTGVLPLQVLLLRQATQVFVVVLQTGVLPLHCPSTTHATQVPFLQPGVAPLQGAPLPHLHRSPVQVSPVGAHALPVAHCASQKQIARAFPSFADPAFPTRFQVTKHRSFASVIPFSTTDDGVPATVCSAPMQVCHSPAHGAVIPSTDVWLDPSEPVTYPP
jgi:hypothetical protein